MIKKEEFKKKFGAVFFHSGFVKKGQSWYLRGANAIVVVNLQKSDYAEKYYVNIGIWLLSLGASELPKDTHCQIQIRLGSLFSEHRSLIDKACSLEYAEGADIEQLLTILREQLVPFCQVSLTSEGLQKSAKSELFNSALIFKEARNLLGM